MKKVDSKTVLNLMVPVLMLEKGVRVNWLVCVFHEITTEGCKLILTVQCWTLYTLRVSLKSFHSVS